MILTHILYQRLIEIHFFRIVFVFEKNINIFFISYKHINRFEFEFQLFYYFIKTDSSWFPNWTVVIIVSLYCFILSVTHLGCTRLPSKDHKSKLWALQKSWKLVVVLTSFRRFSSLIKSKKICFQSIAVRNLLLFEKKYPLVGIQQILTITLTISCVKSVPLPYLLTESNWGLFALET